MQAVRKAERLRTQRDPNSRNQRGRRREMTEYRVPAPGCTILSPPQQYFNFYTVHRREYR